MLYIYITNQTPQEAKNGLMNAAQEDTMNLHDGTENGAIDATNNNLEITTSMKVVSAHHNGGIF